MHEQKAREIAAFRYQLISPIVSRTDLAPGQVQELIREAAQKTYQIPYSNRTNVSVRTIERYLSLYRQEGFEGLKPQVHSNRKSRIPEHYLQQAAMLKKENPRRSCEQIIRTLELAGDVPTGVLKRSTVYDYLEKQQLTGRFTKKETKAHQRYQARHRNQRWLADTCHLLYLTDPQNPGRKKRVYLITWIDDFSRLVTHAQCYWAEKLPMLEDSLKKAILKHGVPTQIYVDNGAIYSSNFLGTVCAQLGIHRSRSAPYKPAGRGKVERFFGTVQNSFLIEFYELLKQQELTLNELNEYLWAWLDKYYHQKVHSSTKQTPQLRFESDTHPLRFLDLQQVYEAFLMEENRKVDKTMVFSLLGKKFQVCPELANKKIQVRYDPYDLSAVRVYYQQERYPDAYPATVPEHAFSMVEEKKPEAETHSGLNFLSALRDNHREGLTFNTKEED